MSFPKNRGSRIGRLVPELPEGINNKVVIVRVEHRLPDNVVLSEVILFGAQPHQQGHPGPVKRLASPYRGVSFHSCTQRWRSRIKCGSKSEHLGYFVSDLEAAKAYNEAARKIHGSNAQLNEGVEQALGEGNEVVSSIVETSKMPYDGQTFYTDSPLKERKASSPRSLTKQQQKEVVVQQHEQSHNSSAVVVPISALDPDDFIVKVKPEAKVAAGQSGRRKSKVAVKSELLNFMDLDSKVDIDTRLPEFNNDESDDVFLNLWFNEQSLASSIDDFFLGHTGSSCGTKRERDSLFSLGLEQPKRIRC